MASTVLKFTIFDSGIRFEDTGYTKAEDFIREKLKGIKVTAALGDNPNGWTKVALAFGLTLPVFDTTSMVADTVTRRYYLNNNKESVVAPKNPMIEDSINVCDESLLGFWQDVSTPNPDHDTYGSWYRIFIQDINSSGTIEGNYKDVTTIETNTPFYPDDLNNTLMAIYNSAYGNIADLEKRHLALLIQRTFRYYDKEANEPVFIPLEQLEWVNDPVNGFFNNLAVQFSKLQGLTESGTAIILPTPEMVRLYIMMVSICPDDSVVLPMGTVKSVAIY
jgi:hypothetical protein